MSSYYQIAITRDFLHQLHNLDRAIFAKWQRIGRMIYKDPFDRSLRTHPVERAQEGVFSAELDDNYRIIFRHIKPDHIMLFWVDKHDPAYEKAARVSVTIEDGKVKVLETTESGMRSSTQQMFYHSQPMGLLFARWSDEELMKCGLSADWLPAFRQMNTLNDFQHAEEQIPTQTFDALFSLLLEAEEPKEGPGVSDTQLKVALSQPETREDIYVFETGEEFEKALAGSLAEWMLFLHPSQKQIVEANFNGPARIKGGAGTGKTVVALHRTRHLARTLATTPPDKILVLSFNNRLAVVMGELLKRLCNDDEYRRIEVKTLHQWCAWYLRHQCYERLDKADDSRTSNILDVAIQQAHLEFPESRVFSLSRDFIEDEIRYVIKGRAVTSLDEYLQLKRTGRGTPLGTEERQVIFRIYCHYQQGLSPLCDWDDFILKSLRHIQRGTPSGAYVAVVVDEAQDFTEAAMRLIGHIAGNGSNKLLLIGDGQQKIYKGGFALKNVGISIIGRSRILRYNYRNTREILQAAYSMVRNVVFDDLEDEEDIAPPSPEFPHRSGPKPVLKCFLLKEDEIRWVAMQISERVSKRRVNTPGDIGILYMSGKQYGNVIDRVLNAYGLQVTELRRDNANAFFEESSVKRCTFYSAKGMEFKVVFLVGVTDGTIPTNPALPEDALEDTVQRERRLLFVAMTRARDALYISWSEGQPSRFLADIEPGLLNTM
jgi:superfamily I DNA/RNA helicase/mRNA-degrading endonuclease RelE of RelBE toxin-antitoxin system